MVCGKPTETYSDPPPSSSHPLLCFTFCHPVFHSHFSLFLSPSFSHCFSHSSFIVCLSLCYDPALCIPSCLIKACIINTAISLSIFLPRSYDCYIKCKLFRCNSLLMFLLQSVFLVHGGKGERKNERKCNWDHMLLL